MSEQLPSQSNVADRQPWQVNWVALLVPAAIVFALDQFAKVIMLNSLGPNHPPIFLIGEIFGLTVSFNTGAAFGILPMAGDIFLIVAFIMIAGIILFYRRMPLGHWSERIALGMVLGGALGNALDRLRLGYVVDWVLVRIPNVLVNISNFADHAIVLGIGFLFLKGMFNKNERTDSHPPAEAS
jgi:signal peptidase II